MIVDNIPWKKRVSPFKGGKTVPKALSPPPQPQKTKPVTGRQVRSMSLPLIKDRTFSLRGGYLRKNQGFVCKGKSEVSVKKNRYLFGVY